VPESASARVSFIKQEKRRKREQQQRKRNLNEPRCCESFLQKCSRPNTKASAAWIYMVLRVLFILCSHKVNRSPRDRWRSLQIDSNTTAELILSMLHTAPPQPSVSFLTSILHLCSIVEPLLALLRTLDESFSFKGSSFQYPAFIQAFLMSRLGYGSCSLLITY
jgi:hypothetical protein